MVDIQLQCIGMDCPSVECAKHIAGVVRGHQTNPTNKVCILILRQEGGEVL